MNKSNRKILMTVAVAAFLVISVLTAATAGVSAEAEEPTVEEENVEQPDTEQEIDIDELVKQMDRDPTKQTKELDVMDPELTQHLSGGEVPDDPGLMTDNHTISQHQVDQVHDMGIDGQGVKVSLMDTGFDMAHPDLVGQQAVFDYNASTMDPEMEMYDGYPIAFDPVSMADYAYDGEISEDYDDWYGSTDNSWYVNTSYETTAYANDTGVIMADFTEKEENITYEMPSGVADGDMVRFGLHPDEKLNVAYGERPAVLLTQDTEGNWTNVYVDLLNDREFVDETHAMIDGSDPDSEAINRDIDGDGIADVSGGMLYFASNGDMPIPYSQNFRETMNKIINLNLGYPPGTIGMLTDYTDAWHLWTGQDEIHTTPDDGEMIALMGDFNSFGSYGAHGTWTASAVAGQGVTGVPDGAVEGDSPYPPTPEGGDGLPRGLAPNASIIPMGRFFDALPMDNPLGQVATTYSSVFFTAEGYTGDVSITSDSADIASSSFGSTVGKNHGGFNFYERLFDYVGTQYTQNTLYINSQGNEGSGFGTVSSPSGAEGILSVGATGNQNYRTDPWNNYDGGNNPWPVDGDGEVTGMTSTGPHSIGSHGPDIMTNGQYGYGADPINQQLNNIGTFQGNNSWTLWSGTSLSAPNAAGIAALVSQAYEDTHGDAPDAQTLKNIIMQGADDLKNSVHGQGPGEANAYESVMIAQGNGLYNNEFQWRPGTNPEIGQHVEHHVNVMEPGETVTDSLTLENWDTETVDYNMTAYKQEKVGNTSIELNSGTTGPHADGRVPRVMINETGVYNLMYNGTNDNWEVADTPMATLDNPNADLLRLGVHTPKENLGMYGYSLTEFYNWEDADGNGSFDGFDERNRIGYTWANMAALGYDQTSDYMTIQDAMDRTEDGIVVQMNNILPGLMEDFDFTLNIEQYNQVQWDWITATPSSGTIVGGASQTYQLETNVPADTPKGIYGGKLMIDDTTNGRTHPIPITITVGEYTNLSQPVEFGAAEGTDDHGIYKNDRLYGSYTGGLTGDWRTYTFHLQNATDSSVEIDLDFGDANSDMSAYLLGGPEHDELGLGEINLGPGLPTVDYSVDPFSVEMGIVDPDWNMADRYGANRLEAMETSRMDNGDSVKTVTHEPLEAGTYMVVVQSHAISGNEPYEEFSGEIKESNVTTLETANVQDDRATLSGELLEMPDGTSEVNVSFQYRMAGEMTWTTTEAQTLTEAQEFSETIEGLESGTAYEFRTMIEWNPTQYGTVQEFTTMDYLNPADGDVVYGDSLMIELGLVEDIDVAEITLDGDWFGTQDMEISGNEAMLDIPVMLSEGEHTYDLYAEDAEGTIYETTVTFQVDNSDPMLDITSPMGRYERFMGLGEFTLTIEGMTEPGSSVWINGEAVDVDASGQFSEEYLLGAEGLHVFTIEVETEQGNRGMKEVYALALPSLEALQNEVDAIQNEIDQLQQDITDINEDIDDLQAELENKTDELQRQINDFRRELSELEDELKGEIDGVEQDLQADIDQLQNDLDEAESDLNQAERDINNLEDEQGVQDDDISMARNLGIVGIILAILAIIIAIVAMTRGGTTEEEEPMYEEEEEMTMEEEYGEEETEEEEMFGEEETGEEEIFEEPEESEEELFEEEPEE